MIKKWKYIIAGNRRAEILAEGIGLRAKGKIILQSTLFSSFLALCSQPFIKRGGKPMCR